MTSVRIALCQYPITAPATLPAWTEKLDKLVAQAKAANADLLVMPEYASMELAAAYPGAGDPAAELESVAAVAEQALAIMRETAMRHDVWLLPGTLPWRDANRVRNRAPLISPTGHVVFQDKSVMTRFEAESWGVQPGDPPAVFDTPFGRIGIAICYDAEFPDLVRAQVEAGAWLILAPSCTDAMRGYMRVHLSARARALENQCFVAMAPTVGTAPALASVDENVGAAGVFGPVDRGFAEDGIVVQGVLNAPGWIYADLDPARLDAVRADGAVRNWRDRPASRPVCAIVQTRG
jgi:predicted amidohydrolase